ncbi:IclR family transcriptional regulator [Allosalinactinospora lopnorensis]|uniref:IclR family transcriptional regulator n=1 Tax=Allosalinactinospora lopnorensis TaxID=1352348 RepID=UPI000623D2BD|nr:IclR family transcriptional regulator [Allosalinactinospora lopnorensis]
MATTETAASAASSPRTVQSVTRAVRLLKEIGRAAEPSALSDLAREAGLSKPAVYNLLKTLEIEGLVRKGSDARYSLTWGIYELGTAALRGVDVSRIARSHLDSLAARTGEATLLAILEDDAVLYLDRGQSAETFSMIANVGRRSPLHTNASGKVLLAGQDPIVIDRILDGPLERSTPCTHVDRREILSELELVRREGFALCSQEQEIGLSSVSVPIRDHTGSVHAALTVAGPSTRVDRRAKLDLVDTLKSESAVISEKLGAPQP